MKKIQQGFTLIELMIVVAIIGILAAVAIPAYQDYTIRAQVSEGPQLANGLKTSIADYYASKGTWPADNAALGITAAISGTYVSDISNANGVITITYGNEANAANLAGKVLTIRPATSAAGDIAWVCGKGPVPSGATVVGTDATDVDDKYLPAACRP
ncbi:MAG TPA: pilin [Gammaproteobacteria bacterium]|nr:pilin [Gammaproteobacteria bacterium]